MANIQVQNVLVPSRIEWQTSRGGPIGEEALRIEIYTGNVVVELSEGKHVNGTNVLTYLPLNNIRQIRTYASIGSAPQPTINSAILVSPIGIQAHEDEEFLSSIDTWALQLRAQTFGADSVLCLILTRIPRMTH